MVGILLQCAHIPNHYDLHFNILFVNYPSIKLKKKIGHFFCSKSNTYFILTAHINLETKFPFRVEKFVVEKVDSRI